MSENVFEDIAAESHRKVMKNVSIRAKAKKARLRIAAGKGFLCFSILVM